MPVDPHLLVRAGALYATVVLTLVAWAVRRPTARDMSGGVLACLWNLPTLMALNLAAAHYGWWRFDAHGGVFLGVPIDFLLAWAWLWGVVPIMAFPKLPLGLVAGVALAFDLALMPAMSPVLRLGPAWLAGDVIGLFIAFIPGQLLARWTMRDAHLGSRVALQVIAFCGLMLFLLPASIIEGSGTTWMSPLARPVWQLSLIVQMLAIPAATGLSAVQEFATRGAGTPVPFDPPRRLVMTGLYAYVRNPMQLSAVVLLLLLGVALQNVWIAIAGVMAHIYSAGLAGWDEDEDLRRRFGADWDAYRRGVRSWIPRLRPWRPAGRPDARLYVAESCGMCSEVGRWFGRRRASGLIIVPAETHASGALTRITYEPADGAGAATGVAAVSRALEHLHLGWALVGAVLRLPIVCQLLQLLADASGGEPRQVSYGVTPLAQPSSSRAFRRRADSCR
jgi:protein-S-isoprenylcysteine O-methyltransferase Ste14